MYCHRGINSRMNKQPYLKFSSRYNKLNYELLTTIRRYDKTYYEEGKTILVKSPHKVFEAVIIMKIKRKLKDIPLDFLLQDTETESYIEAMNLFNLLYKKPLEPQEELTILILKKV